MAHIETPPSGPPDWRSELRPWIERVKKLRKEIRDRQTSADVVVYNADFQSRFEALDAFIARCGESSWRSAWKLRRTRMRDWMHALEAGSSPQSPNTESPDTKSPDTEIYNTFKSMRKMCETAADQFLRQSWKYDGKELDSIVQLMEKLYGNATDGDVGLGSLGAHGEKTFVNADGEGAEKPPCEDDGGLEPSSLEHGIELITLNGPG
jgi:hypothetical protein